MSADPLPLDDLRREIDAIDDRIQDLLAARTALIERVGRTKGRQRLYMRPGREAALIRRLAARHASALPLAVLVRLWREIIAASTQMQGAFAVAVAAADLWDLARDHYGSVTPMRAEAGPAEALDAVAAGSTMVAVLPWPAADDPDPWWRRLMAAGAPRVIAALPFAPQAGSRRALAVAALAPEPTGDDVSLLAVAGAPDGLAAALAAAGLAAEAIWEAPGDGVPARLAAVAGFVTADDPRLGVLAARLGGARATPIGAYATPLAPS